MIVATWSGMGRESQVEGRRGGGMTHVLIWGEVLCVGCVCVSGFVPLFCGGGIATML